MSNRCFSVLHTKCSLYSERYLAWWEIPFEVYSRDGFARGIKSLLKTDAEQINEEVSCKQDSLKDNLLAKVAIALKQTIYNLKFYLKKRKKWKILKKVWFLIKQNR